MIHLHQIKSQASPYWDSLVRVYLQSFPIDEQRPIASIARLIEHDERFVVYAVLNADVDDDVNDNQPSRWHTKLSTLNSKPSRFVPVPTRNESVGCDDENFSSPKESKTCLNSYCERSLSSTTELLTLNPIGLLTTWHFETFVYIEHFAIDPALRSQGYGTEALKTFISKQEKPIILEAEPPTDDITRRRIGFYQRNGLTMYDFPYIQPAYTPESKPVELRLMGTLNTNVTPLTLISSTLYRTVYKSIE